MREIALNCDVEHAFAVFTGMIDAWWPRGHRRHSDGSLRLDARQGGALIDRAADGSEWTMGKVVAFEPPHRLDLDWYPGSSGAPTAVQVRFVAAGSGCSITVTHRPLPDSQAVWPAHIATFTTGWDAVLPALKTFIEEH